MDPSSFNLNRIGNAIRARSDWRNGKRRGPPSLWAPVIVILVILIALGLFFFFGSRGQTNWTILKHVPPNQANRVESTATTLNYKLSVPTRLPYQVTGASANLTTNGAFQTIEIKFKGNQDVIVERVTNEQSTAAPIGQKQAVKLPDGAAATTINGLPILSWHTKDGVSYKLSISKWSHTNRPNVAALVSIYKNMK